MDYPGGLKKKRKKDTYDFVSFNIKKSGNGILAVKGQKIIKSHL